VARFQALSAFSGTGFTTREAERIVNHPRRRKIVIYLIMLGNAGIVSVIATFVVTLRGSGTLRPCAKIYSFSTAGVTPSLKHNPASQLPNPVIGVAPGLSPMICCDGYR
jgi:hypothetical protein